MTEKVVYGILITEIFYEASIKNFQENRNFLYTSYDDENDDNEK